LNAAVPLLELIDVRAGYSQPVVGPVSFAVHPGEVLGLQGANGIGKSTIIKVITGGARLFGGTLRRTADLTINHHWQRPERPPELPVTGLEMLRVTGAATSALPPRLGALCARCLDEMSGGEFQLLHAWACLTGAARLVVLDEPTNNLDQQAIELLLAEIHQRPSDRAILLVSHEAAFLERACDRIVPLCP